jgi:acyl-CoA hydrolase
MEIGSSFSRAETCLIMEPRLSNIHGTAHGGELMKIMDSTAGIAAAKHAKGPVVTARVDELVFHRPIRIGDIVTCIAQLCYVGRTSMQVMVRIVVHELENYQEPETALSAFFTMVHMEGGVPAAVRAIVPETDEERELYRQGEEKYREIRAKYKQRT